LGVRLVPGACEFPESDKGASEAMAKGCILPVSPGRVMKNPGWEKTGRPKKKNSCSRWVNKATRVLGPLAQLIRLEGTPTPFFYRITFQPTKKAGINQPT